MKEEDRDALALDVLLYALYRRWGYDFRHYLRESIARSTARALERLDCPGVLELIPRVLDDPGVFATLLSCYAVGVTRMFRDPSVYRVLREEVVPYLRTWPAIKVWCAGCATGEEAYSLAILLREVGLLERVTLYATDIDNDALRRARSGCFPLSDLESAGRDYRAAGGGGELADHYTNEGDRARLDEALRARIVFSAHNLVTDAVFAETHLIFCRNVLIYFDPELRERALGLFADSLAHGGFLCLGSHETLVEPHHPLFLNWVRRARIYKKRAACPRRRRPCSSPRS